MGSYEYQGSPVCVCGDFNGNSLVELSDFATFAACYSLPEPTPDCDATTLYCCDLNADGDVNLLDFATFAVIYGVPASGSPPNCQ